MTKFLIKPFIGIVLNGVILYLVIRVVDGVTYTGGIKFFVLGGIVLGLINFFIRPIIKIFSLPFVFITGGLVLIVVNVFILKFLSYFLAVAQFENVTLTFSNLGACVIGAVVFGIINWTVNLFVK